MKFTDYKKAISQAWDNGYRAGWVAHEELPKVKGAHSAAKYGFSRGLSRHKKADKYSARAKKK